MGKNKKQRAKARKYKAMKENENKPHGTEIKKEPGCKKRKQEHIDKFDSDKTHQKSPTRKNMDSSSLIKHQQDVNGGDESNLTNNEVGMSKQIDENAVYFDNREQGGFTDQNIKNDNISSSITHSTGEKYQNKNEPSHFMDDKNTHEETNNGPSEVKNIAQDFINDKPDKGVPLNLNKSAVNVSTKILITAQPFKEFEITNNISKDEGNTFSASHSEIRKTIETLDDLSNENTENGKENDDGDGFINETVNGKSINGHIPKSREDLDKEITADDTGGNSFDNGLQNQQGQSQGDFTDEETVDNTFHFTITDDSLDNNQNEEETTEKENNLMSDKCTDQNSEEDDRGGSIGAKKDTKTFPIFNTETVNTREDDVHKSDDTFRSSITDDSLDNNQNEEVTTEKENNLMSDKCTDHHSEEDDHDGRIGAKKDTETFPISNTKTLNTREDDVHKSDDEQHLIETNSCINMTGGDILQALEYPQNNFQNQESFADINHIKANSTSTNTINCEEQCGSISSTPNIDSSNQGQNDQLSQLNDITVQAESSTTLLGYVQQPREELGKTAVNEEISLLKTQPDSYKEDSESINVQIPQSVDETEEAFHQKFETLQQQLESVTKENGNLSECKSRLENELKCEKEELEELKERANELEREKVQIQQSVDETEKAFQQKLGNLQQQLESVTKDNGNLSECKSRLENELKCEKEEREELKERANELEREKVQIHLSVDETEKEFQQKLGNLQQQLESVTKENGNLSDIITESWKESTEKAQQKLTSFELELKSVRQEKEQVVEHKNQLEEQLLQVKDELEGWKQNNARLERQQECQQSIEKTNNDLQHNLTSLQHKLESAKEDNSKLSEGKTQLERELKKVIGQLDESREESNELQNQNEEIQQYMEETKQSLHQELSLLQNQLDSVNQENSNIQDEKNQLVQSQQELNDELKECKSKLAMLENRKEQLNISTKVIEDTIKQQYSEIQSHLESNGSEGQDYKILSDEKDQLEEQLMQVNSELDEMKETLVALENIKGEKDQLEQELDRMRDIASQLESMKEENERYREQYQQINDQLRTTKQQLEQSCQECEGLSADLVRKSEKEDHYRYIETMVVTLGREKESHLKEIQELKNKVDLVEEVLISLKEEKKMKDETIKQLRADVQIKEENSHQIKRQYEAGIEQLQTMGQLRDSEIENQKREIERISSQKQQLEGNINQTSLELQTRQGDLQREQLEHNQTRNTLTQYIEAIKKMNSQIQSKDKEIEIMQEEVNKVRIERRELQLKYRDLPQKEAHFKVIENSNQNLMDENAQLQERIRSFGPFESTLHYIREENSRLSWESQRYQERISFMEQKYRDQTCNIQQLTEEVQVFRGHRIELKRQLHQKTDEAEAVSRRLKETLEKKESLEKALLDAQEENSTYPESQTFDDSHGTEVHSFQGQRNSRGRIIRRTDIQNF
ncbi:interaptin-like isoform X2 [Mytilus edulis]|uniref:interaptin-like isoform X2 n=1 Tax=Mytilus edulis TaxID=6550 RepID=UPI0039EE0CDA